MLLRWGLYALPISHHGLVQSCPVLAWLQSNGKDRINTGCVGWTELCACYASNLRMHSHCHDDGCNFMAWQPFSCGGYNLWGYANRCPVCGRLLIREFKKFFLDYSFRVHSFPNEQWRGRAVVVKRLFDVMYSRVDYGLWGFKLSLYFKTSLADLSW